MKKITVTSVLMCVCSSLLASTLTPEAIGAGSPWHPQHTTPFTSKPGLAIPMQSSPMDGDVPLQWSQNFEMAEGQTSFEDGQLIPLSDGSIGIYTTGAGIDLSEGRVVKFDAVGNKVWDQSLQIETSTTAQRVAIGSDGDIFVAGTTLVDVNVMPYVAKLSKEGILLKTTTLDIKQESINIQYLGASEKGLSLFCLSRSPKTLEGEYYCSSMSYELTDVSTEAYSIDGALPMPASVVANAEHLLAVIEAGPYTPGSLLIFNIKDGGQPLVENGDYKAASVNGSKFYIVEGGTSNYIVKNTNISDAGLITDWQCNISRETNYYTPVVTCADDGNVYFWHRAKVGHFVAKIDGSNGTKVWTKTIGEFGDSRIEEGFVYAMGVDSKGDFVAGGHSANFKIYWYRLAATDGALSNFCDSLIDKDYPFAYSYDNMSSYSNDKFYFSGWLKNESMTDGNASFFAEFDTNDQTGLIWHSMASRGYVSDNLPCNGYIDPDGNIYAAVTVTGKPALAKYGTTGSFEWYSKCSVGTGQARFVFADASGSLTLLSTAEGEEWFENNLIVSDFTPDGTMVSTEVYKNELIMPTLLTAALDPNNNIYAV